MKTSIINGSEVSRLSVAIQAPIRFLPQPYPDGKPISIARSQRFPSMKNAVMDDYHLN